jgi:hypothetical protein
VGALNEKEDWMTTNTTTPPEAVIPPTSRAMQTFISTSTVLIKLVCSFELPNRLTKTRRCTHRVERLECAVPQPYLYLTPITID